MKTKTIKISALFLVLVTVMVLCACTDTNQNSQKLYNGAELTSINFGSDNISVNGKSVGNDSYNAVYTSKDIIYYENLEEYPSGNPYGEGEESDRHTKKEADEHTVVNITAPGTYKLSGKLEPGQIRVDLGKDARKDPEAKVTLILDGLELTSTVAPAILFMNTYECDNEWSTESASAEVNTENAGANIIIADGSKNTVNGAYVAKIFKDDEDEKKLWKQDGAIYSYTSLNVNGEAYNTGLLDLYAENEGLDSELHLTINGGNINIRSQNDGINTNEDGVSVTTINGGNIHIIAGLGNEGDGIDSNGWLVINGGTVISSANPASDAGLDSDMGSFINGGTVVALGSTMDWAESDSDQITMNLQFDDYKESDSAIIITRQDASVVFAYDPAEDEVVGENIRKYKGAIISTPELKLEETYNLYIGGEIIGNEISGIYDPTSISSYNGAIKQGFTGTDVMRGFGGARPGFGGKRPDLEMPEGGEVPEMPQGNRGEFEKRPEGDFNKERPERKGERPGGGFEMPDMDKGFNPPEGFEGANQGIKPLMTEFYMQDKVNFFSGVRAYNETVIEAA